MASQLIVFSPEAVHRIEEAFRVTYTLEIGKAPTHPAQMMAGIPMTGTKETYWWPEPTLQIRKREESGGDMQFQTLRWANRTLTVDPFGLALKIDAYAERDFSANAQVDIGASFGEQCGAKAGCFPARAIQYLMKNGADATKVNTWEGESIPLWHTSHKVTSGSSYRFCNTFGGMPLNAINLAAGLAYIAQIEDGTGDFKGLERSVTLVTGTTKRARGIQLLDAQSITDMFNVDAKAAASNIMSYKGQWGFNAPIVSPYFDFEPTKWWLVSNTWSVPEQAPLHMPELESWNMISFSNMNQVTLAQQESLEYYFKGRIGAQAGRPERIFQFDSAGSQDDAKMASILTGM